MDATRRPSPLTAVARIVHDATLILAVAFDFFSFSSCLDYFEMRHINAAPDGCNNTYAPRLEEPKRGTVEFMFCHQDRQNLRAAPTNSSNPITISTDSNAPLAFVLAH